MNPPKILIAGPCSAETEQQVMTTATALAGHGITTFRAGIWKPRTRPGGFEGLGRIALEWMEELAARYGVAYCCEVASPEHVELCSRHGVAAVWLGARTTANPFMVEELCEALRGRGMAVMVKNPVCPDARLWVGAVERLKAAGVADVAAVHRGFNMYNNRGYRNAPMWEVAMEFRRECPEVPILCDPSHMGGRRELVEPIARAAVQLDYDGLMVEVHPDPSSAWSDGGQQLEPAGLEALLAELEGIQALRGGSSPRLLPLREQIDEIDHELVALLAQRMAVSRRIAGVKRELGMAVYQSDRWQTVLADRLRQAEELGLDPDFTRDLLEKIHGESVRIQMEGAE